jgi:transposase
MPTYIGLDVHLNSCHATAMDEQGRILAQERLGPSEALGFVRRFKDPAIPMEACYCWQPIWDILEFEGYELKLAHPTKTRLMAEARVKTDALDSRLAHLLRANLLPTAYVPPREIRELRELVRLRVSLVRERAAHKARLRAELAKRGIRFTSSFTKNAKKFLLSLSLGVRRRGEPLDDRVLGRRIRSLDAELRRRTKGREGVRLLQTIPGIGEFSAVAILAEVGEIGRFPTPEHLCSYAGLVPSVHQSGNSRYYGHITKQGSSLLRWVMQSACGPT